MDGADPDDFMLALLDLSPAAVVNAVREQADGLKNPPRTLSDVLDTLRENGLVQSVAKLRELCVESDGGQEGCVFGGTWSGLVGS